MVYGELVASGLCLTSRPCASLSVLLVSWVSSLQLEFILNSGQGSSGRALGRRNVLVTRLHTGRVYDCSAARRATCTVGPEVGCSVVKMRNN